MAYDFHGRTALVTGASRGIGKEVTKQLVKSGAKVYALARTKENLDALKAEVPEVKTICMDIGDWKKTKKMIEEIDDDVDLLVNNAAIAKMDMFGEITEELIDSILAVNLKSAINISQVIVEKLKKRGKPGSIVNISSVAALLHVEKTMMYCISKAALDKLTKMMAVELAPYKIRVNSVNPTLVETDMAKAFSNEDWAKEMMKTIPLNDICRPADITDSILFLLSDKARMVTGTILAVDGGQCSK